MDIASVDGWADEARTCTCMDWDRGPAHSGKKGSCIVCRFGKRGVAMDGRDAEDVYLGMVGC
jgi:hypothetical protein